MISNFIVFAATPMTTDFNDTAANNTLSPLPVPPKRCLISYFFTILYHYQIHNALF